MQPHYKYTPYNVEMFYIVSIYSYILIIQVIHDMYYQAND